MHHVKRIEFEKLFTTKLFAFKLVHILIHIINIDIEVYTLCYIIYGICMSSYLSY